MHSEKPTQGKHDDEPVVRAGERAQSRQGSPLQASEEDPVDEMERESFPASDAPSTWAGPPTG